MDRSACFDVPRHHANLWEDYSAEASEVSRVSEAGDAKAAGFGDGFMPETFHRLYAEAPAEIAPDARGRAAAVRAKLHALASELPEFDTLRKQTVRDPMWAGMAATAIADNVARALPARESTPDADRARALLEGLRAVAEISPEAAAKVATRITRAEGTLRGEEIATEAQAADLDESAIRNALRAGIAAAHDAIDDAGAALAALGWGEGSGSGVRPPRDPGVAIELARRVSGSETLRRIVALVGRLTLTARAKRAARTEYARSEVTGVEQTRHLARVLPAEMVGLSSPLGTAALYRKILEGSALGYRMAGREREAKGPIVVAIDQSGSMASGGRDEWAKAVALALLDTARAERRAFGVILYADNVIASRLFPVPQAIDPRAILDLLASAPDGGTSYAPAFALALDWIENPAKHGAPCTFKRADLVHVTDGAASTADAANMLARARRVGCHVYGIGIGGAVGPALAAWSDETAEIRDVNADSPAIDLVFDSI